MFGKHPKALFPLFVTEIWERFGFYIMSAIFVLYMQHDLGFNATSRGILYAVFLGSSYLFPLIGGLLGDRKFGQIKTIRIGGYFIAIGYTLLALSSTTLLSFFYLGIVFVTFGTGIFKVNLAVLIGALYKEKPSLRDAGYNIYYMGINIGAALGPLSANLIGYLFDSYNLSFLAAAIGMILSILIFEFNKKVLIKFDSKLIDQKQSTQDPTSKDAPKMSTTEYRDRIITLVILFLIASLFWIPFYQNGIGLTYYVDRSTVQYDLLRPEVYLSFNAIFIIILTPIMLGIFSRLQKKNKEPVTPVKIFLGLLIMGCSMLIMVWASLRGGNLDKNIMSPMWVVFTYLVVTLAEILISPLGQSYVSKVAPPKVQGLMMGGWFGATALGGMTAGIIGAFYDKMPHHQYFLIFAILTFIAAILILFIMKKLRKYAV